MSLPWATRGLKIPYVDRNDRQSRSLAIATAPSSTRSSRNLPRETTSQGSVSLLPGQRHRCLSRLEATSAKRPLERRCGEGRLSARAEPLNAVVRDLPGYGWGARRCSIVVRGSTRAEVQRPGFSVSAETGSLSICSLRTQFWTTRQVRVRPSPCACAGRPTTPSLGVGTEGRAPRLSDYPLEGG